MEQYFGFVDPCHNKDCLQRSVSIQWPCKTETWEVSKNLRISEITLQFFFFFFFFYYLGSMQQLTEADLILQLCRQIWTVSWQNQQTDCAPSEDSDQPGLQPSLIRVFAVRLKKHWVFSYPLSAQWRLWSDWVDALTDRSLRWPHSQFVGFAMRRLIWVFVVCKCHE